MLRFMSVVVVLVAVALGEARAELPVKVGVFAVDASPPVGSPLAYDPTKGVTQPLSCRGIVLIGEGRPIVLCAVNWIGIANDGQVEFRKALERPPGPIRSELPSTRYINTTLRSAISPRTACSPIAGSTARSSMRPSPVT